MRELLGLLRGFLTTCDEEPRLLLADWCEENGDQDLARHLREGIPLAYACIHDEDLPLEASQGVGDWTDLRRVYSMYEWNTFRDAGQVVVDQEVYESIVFIVGSTAEEVNDEWNELRREVEAEDE